MPIHLFRVFINVLVNGLFFDPVVHILHSETHLFQEDFVVDMAQ